MDSTSAVTEALRVRRKAHRVIDSCDDARHLPAAARYADLARRRIIHLRPLLPGAVDGTLAFIDLRLRQQRKALGA